MIGDRLAAAGRMRGIGQAELAAELEDRCDNSIISKAGKGRSNLLVDRLIEVVRILDVSADYLLGLTDDATSAAGRVPTDLDSRLGTADFLRMTQDHEIPGRTEGSAARPRVRSLLLPR